MRRSAEILLGQPLRHHRVAPEKAVVLAPVVAAEQRPQDVALLLGPVPIELARGLHAQAEALAAGRDGEPPRMHVAAPEHQYVPQLVVAEVLQHFFQVAGDLLAHHAVFEPHQHRVRFRAAGDHLLDTTLAAGGSRGEGDDRVGQGLLRLEPEPMAARAQRLGNRVQQLDALRQVGPYPALLAAAQQLDLELAAAHHPRRAYRHFEILQPALLEVHPGDHQVVLRVEVGDAQPVDSGRQQLHRQHHLQLLDRRHPDVPEGLRPAGDLAAVELDGVREILDDRVRSGVPPACARIDPIRRLAGDHHG